MKIILTFITALLLTACAGNSPRHDTAYALKYYSRALDAFRQKNYDNALDYINKTIEANNRIAGYFELKGDILARLGNLSAAEEAFADALTRRSHYDGVLEKLGDLNFAQKKFKQAVDYYQKAFAQNNKKLKLLLKSAEAHVQLRHYSIAKNVLNDYRNFSKKQKVKKSALFFAEHARLMFETGKYFTVITDLKAGERRARLNRNLVLIYIQSFYNTEQLEEGYSMATEVYRPFLKPADVHYFRALYYFNMKNEKDGRTQLQLALKKGCTIPDAYRMQRQSGVKQDDRLPEGVVNRFLNVGYDFNAFLDNSIGEKHSGKKDARTAGS